MGRINIMTTEQTTVHTADIVLLQRQQGKPSILLIKRCEWPYPDMWALPGGKQNPGGTIEETAYRELREETGVEVAILNLVGTFDTPGRDPRGNFVSAAFMVRLADSTIISAQAGDDAKEVVWFPLDELPALAFDHAEIIQRACMVDCDMLLTTLAGAIAVATNASGVSVQVVFRHNSDRHYDFFIWHELGKSELTPDDIHLRYVYDVESLSDDLLTLDLDMDAVIWSRACSRCKLVLFHGVFEDAGLALCAEWHNDVKCK
jgi:8-oxo-dGTP diphosphatase